MNGIMRDVPTRIASVEGSDHYGVVLYQASLRVEYTPEEALELSAELAAMAAGMIADRVEDLAHADALAGADAPGSHAFDLVPICRECTESKHGACDGSALIEVGAEADVQSVPCGCAEAGHRMLGDES